MKGRGRAEEWQREGRGRVEEGQSKCRARVEEGQRKEATGGAEGSTTGHWRAAAGAKWSGGGGGDRGGSLGYRRHEYGCGDDRYRLDLGRGAAATDQKERCEAYKATMRRATILKMQRRPRGSALWITTWAMPPT